MWKKGKNNFNTLKTRNKQIHRKILKSTYNLRAIAWKWKSNVIFDYIKNFIPYRKVISDFKFFFGLYKKKKIKSHVKWKKRKKEKQMT